MFNKKLWLVAGYVCGAVVTSLYNKKSASDLKQSLDQGELISKKNFRILFDSFIETHKNFLHEVETQLASQENKQKFEAKKTDILNLVEIYKADAKNMLAQLKEKGQQFASQASDKIEHLYHETLLNLENHAEATSTK